MLPEDVRVIALLLHEVVEGAHSGDADFRVRGRIFATLWIDDDRVVLKLTPEMQAVMVEAEPGSFQPIPGSWGGRGWTNVDLTDLDEGTLRSALLTAWRAVAPPGLIALHEPDATD